MPTTYDRKSKRYRDSRGRFISEKTIRREIDKAVKVFENDAAQLATRLTKGRINSRQFERLMRNLIKDHHIINSSVGFGGWKQMTPRRWGQVGATIKKEYKYLKGFVGEIRAGKLSEKQVINRAGQYKDNVRLTYHEFDKAKRNPLQLVMRTLNADESCDDCVSLAGKWMTVAEMPPIGSVYCGRFCKCELSYKNEGE